MYFSRGEHKCSWKENYTKGKDMFLEGTLHKGWNIILLKGKLRFSWTQMPLKDKLGTLVVNTDAPEA